MIFKTVRLLLRPITLADAPAYQRHFNDYDVISQMPARLPWPYPDDGAYTFIRDFVLPQQGRGRWFWGVFLKTAPDELIGGVELWRKGTPDHRGFWLGKSFWGRGFMTEAVAPITDYAFDHLGFEELIFSNASGNLKSRRIKEKTGARLIGLEPSTYVDPTYTHAEKWELKKDDWRHHQLRASTMARSP